MYLRITKKISLLICMAFSVGILSAQNLDTVDDITLCDNPEFAIVFNMYDSYGDGWNDATYGLLGPGGVTASGTLSDGIFGSDTLCTSQGEWSVFVGGGTYDNEITYDIVDAFGVALLSGVTAGTEYTFTITGESVTGGCTDPNAINYDPNATFDDGSCEYEIICNGIEATVNIFTDLYASEMSWELVDLDGASVATGSGFTSDNSTNVCLVEGSSYTMIMMDSYGDGWNGGSFTVVAACD